MSRVGGHRVQLESIGGHKSAEGIGGHTQSPIRGHRRA